MSSVSVFNYLIVFAALCSVGLCRPSDNTDIELNDKANDYPMADTPSEDQADEEGVNDEDVDSNYKEGQMPVFKTLSQVISVDEGQEVLLPCDIENAENFVKVWRNGTEIMFQETARLIADHRATLKNYNLQISNVNKYDSGVYSCGVLLQNQTPQVTHTLHVKEPAKIDIFSPSEHLKIIEKGKSLNLMCHAVGYPQPKVFWTRKVKGSNTPEYLEGTNYTIPSVNREHTGVYECTAKNEDKSEKRSVEVLVQYEPEVSIKSDTVNTAEGKLSEMHCTVYAEPPASLVWLKEDRALKSNDHIKLFQDPNKHHRHILKIDNTKAEDFGIYSCIANNTLGITRKTIVLSGTPLRPVFERASIAKDNKSPRLVWTVESLSPIKSYELQYRKQEQDGWSFAHPKVLPTSDGVHYSVVHDLFGLAPGAYEAVLKAENAYGWSYPSPPNVFSGEDNMSNEIIQGPLEPNPNDASQLRISLALIFSILVARFLC